MHIRRELWWSEPGCWLSFWPHPEFSSNPKASNRHEVYLPMAAPPPEPNAWDETIITNWVLEDQEEAERELMMYEMYA